MKTPVDPIESLGNPQSSESLSSSGYFPGKDSEASSYSIEETRQIFLEMFGPERGKALLCFGEILLEKSGKLEGKDVFP